MKAWRCVALLALFLLGAFMLLEALVLGSFSIQWIAAYALAVGAFTQWGFTAAAGYAAYRGRPMRSWILRSGVTVAASLVVVVVVWGPTDASFRRHHRSQVVPPLPTSRGIVPANRGPFSAQDFMVSNGYFGQLGDNVVTIYAGDNPRSRGGPMGGVRVYARPANPASASGDTYVGKFLSPTGPYFPDDYRGGRRPGHPRLPRWPTTHSIATASPGHKRRGACHLRVFSDGCNSERGEKESIAAGGLDRP